MAQRFAGIVHLYVNNSPVALRGNFVVSPSNIERTYLAGQDRVHGYQELPRVPFVEGDLSTVPDFSLETLEAQVNINVVADLSNGYRYTLTEASCKCGFEANTRDGQVRVRFEGIQCFETRFGA